MFFSCSFKMNVLFLTFCLLFMFQNSVCKNKEGFVEEVSCSSESLTVVINKSDPEVAQWMANPKSQPVVYVYEHKERHPCGTSMKNEKGLVNYNLTIPYGKECDVTLIDLQPNHRTAETTVVLEDNADTSFSKSMRINHVFCLYARSVQTIRFSDVANAHEVVASTGGKPIPKVEMLFKNADGKSLKAAKIGDSIEFFVALSPDSAYHGISPKECVFSDREDINSPLAQKTTFVQSGCPVEQLSEVIHPLANVNDQVYFTKFKTFRFGNHSTVFAHCILQVCLKKEECSNSCFKRVVNSDLTAERLRFRHKRSVGDQTESNITGDTNEIALTNTLTILTDTESEELNALLSYSVPQKECASSDFGEIPMIACLVFFILFLVSSTVSIYLGCRLKQRAKQDSFDMMSAYSNSALSMPVSYSLQQSNYATSSQMDMQYR